VEFLHDDNSSSPSSAWPISDELCATSGRQHGLCHSYLAASFTSAGAVTHSIAEHLDQIQSWVQYSIPRQLHLDSGVGFSYWDTGLHYSERRLRQTNLSSKPPLSTSSKTTATRYCTLKQAGSVLSSVLALQNSWLASRGKHLIRSLSLTRCTPGLVVLDFLGCVA
jgi:hypothetical protein